MKVSGLSPNINEQIENVKSNAKDGISNRQEDMTAVNQSQVDGSATVELSERARDAQKAFHLASEQSVDQAKVDRLQKLIDEGNYQVDASLIADRLVDEHMKLP